jgi:hypothetical protein
MSKDPVVIYHIQNGCVEPGTQSPIEVVFVVSKTETTPDVGEYSPEKLADLFAGTRQSVGRSVQDEYALFTDRTSADNYAKRQSLLAQARMYLRGLTDEQLEEVVPALSKDKIEDTIESLNRYTE